MKIQEVKKIQKYQNRPYSIKVLKKNGEFTEEVNKALACPKVGRKIYHTEYRGSGRHVSVASRAAYLRGILDALGYKYTEGNDAPRGGASGDYIKVSAYVMKRIKNKFA